MSVVNNQRKKYMYATAVIAMIVIAAVGVYWYQSSMKPPVNELTIQTQPGYSDAIKRIIAPVMLAKYNCKLNIEEAISMETVTKTLAQKDDPPFSVVNLDEYPFIIGKGQGLWMKLSANQVPNMANVYDWAREKDDMGVGVMLYSMGVGYRSDIFKQNGFATPTSLYDLWKPEYKGKISIQSSASTWAMFFLIEVTALETGQDDGYKTNIQAGFNKIKTLVPNLHDFHTTSTELNNLLQRGDVTISHAGGYRILGGLKARGVQADFVPTKSVAGMTFLAIPQNAKNKDLALKFIDLSIGEDYQPELFKTQWLGMVNKNVKLNSTMQQLYTVAYPADLSSKLIHVDWTYVAAHQQDWIATWQRTIEIKT
jgi:putative spermidine/putrescine transport system substrate-binding protein